MATVAPRKPFNRAETDRRVRHPLEALRGYIRKYVVFEGLAFALLFMAAWFWIGLVLDYLPFLLLRFDWIKELDYTAGEGASFSIRLVILLALSGTLVGLVAFKVFRRLFREFSDKALALVLERRFPKQLGDRLITAVELADPRLSQKYGFSQDMLDQTIAEAADRVGKLPVWEVFAWGRLKLHCVLAALATVGLWLVVMIAGTIVQGASGRGANPVDFFWEFNHVSGMWFQRNIFLQDRRYWMGNEFLELVRFPGSGELRVARDEDRPDVIFRAVKWAVSDRSGAAPEGWRSMRWSDLPNHLDADTLAVNLPSNWPHWVIDLDDLDPSVPGNVLPPSWHKMTAGGIRRAKEEARQAHAEKLKREAAQDPLNKEDKFDADLLRKAELWVNLNGANALPAVEQLLDWKQWTVDRIEQQLARLEVRAAMKEGNKEAYAAFERVLAELAARADSARMRGTLRQLNVPQLITVDRSGKKARSSSPSNRQDNNKYAFNLQELSESVTFYASGDEYSTAPRRITLVPPPAVVRLTVTKDEPAYMYYRLLDDPGKLKGLRQIFRETPVSTTGPKSVVQVPYGTSVVITGTTDRPLKEGIRLVPPANPEIKVLDKKAPPPVPAVQVKLHDDRKTFSAEFGNVTRFLEFDVDYRDVDGVRGRRHIVIKPDDDKAPKLQGVKLATLFRSDYDPETAKGPAPKGGERMLITPNALLPFKGQVLDDHGLTRVLWTFKVTELNFQKLGEGSGGDEGPSGGPESTEPLGVRRARLVATTFQYMPGSQDFGWYAPAQIAAISFLASEEAKTPKKQPPQLGKFEGPVARNRFLPDAKSATKDDVTFPELIQLLRIQPRHRKLAQDALVLNEVDTQKKFMEELKENGQHQAFLADLVSVVKVEAGEKALVAQLAAAEPGRALGVIVAAANRDKDAKDQLIQLLGKQPEKLLHREFTLESEAGFDLMATLATLKALNSETQKHYELQIFVTAFDNNVETGPGAATPSGPFTFLVVSENELNAEILRQERKLHALLKDSVDQLKGRKITLDAEVIKLEQPQPDLTASIVRVDQARKSLRETRDISRAVLEKYVTILAEMVYNRFEIDKKESERKRVPDTRNLIVFPLRDMNEKGSGDFEIVGRNADTLFKDIDDDIVKIKQALKVPDPTLPERLESRRLLHVTDAKRLGNQLEHVIDRLQKILDAMRDIGDRNKLVEMLVRIEAQRRENHRRLQLHIIEERQRILGGIFDDEPKKK